MADRAGTLERLKAVLPAEYKALGKLRTQRARLLSLGAGPNYPHDAADEGWNKEIVDILPIMRQAAQAEAISLAANCPRVLCSSPYVGRLAFAQHYERAVNLYLKTMHAEEELQACALNAFYSLGVVKVYMADSVPVLLESSEWMDPGRPYMQNISPHHFVYDTGATQFQHCQFMADRYRVSFDYLVADNRFSASLRKKLKDLGPTYSQDIHSEEPWRRIIFDQTELQDLVFLSDVFIPDEGKVYTYIIDRDFNILIDEPLSEVDWDGQETGPYHFLNLGPVPDKTTPSSPAQNLELMANLANSLYRKLQNQAIAQRTLIKFPSGVDDDEITAARDAEDMAFIRSDAPSVTERIGGADQNNFNFFLNTLTQVNRYGGNIDLRLGLGQTADTASQEGILAQGASRAESYNQQIFIKFVRGVVQEIGRLLFTAKTVSFPMTREIAQDIAVDDPWREAIEEGAREGEFHDYDIDVEPFSMAYKSPAQRVMELQQTFGEVMQAAPLYMQQGYMPDGMYYLKEKSRLLNNSCLERLLAPIAPPEEQPGGGHERSMAPNTGPREYIHRSQSSGAGKSPEQEQLAGMTAASADNQAA